MAKRSKKTQKTRANSSGHRSCRSPDLQGFVVVAFTKDMEQAKEYETLLKINDIPVVINEPDEQSIGSKDIAVMVPEDCLDEAHVVIESQDAYDDFYDFATEEEDEGDLEDDYFEDEF